MRAIRVITTFALGFILSSVLLLSAAFAGTDKGNGNEAGQAAFKGNCVACHGADGAGTPLGKSMQAADLRSPEVQKKSDAELSQTIAEGKGNMPSFKRVLNPEHIQAVVKYVRELGKARQ
ncbi:MAG TPA: cytochrome c [Terriglobales bacterium]|nr:cytochrome c [Terriglobales bacterium]